jgi:hypothetical protein
LPTFRKHGYIGNNVPKFAHVQETWLGNNVSWFAHLHETWVGNNDSKGNTLELIELSSTNKISLV